MLQSTVERKQAVPWIAVFVFLLKEWPGAISARATPPLNELSWQRIRCYYQEPQLAQPCLPMSYFHVSHIRKNQIKDSGLARIELQEKSRKGWSWMYWLRIVLQHAGNEHEEDGTCFSDCARACSSWASTTSLSAVIWTLSLSASSSSSMRSSFWRRVS